MVNEEAESTVNNLPAEIENIIDDYAEKENEGLKEIIGRLDNIESILLKLSESRIIESEKISTEPIIEEVPKSIEVLPIKKSRFV